MFRIIISLGFALLFAFAENCDFSKEQSECEIDIKNPPLMLHKFAKDDGSEYSEFRACINGGDIEIDDVRFEVLDCSMVESKSGNLTEGANISNSNNLVKNKIITLKQDNVLMRVAGDLIIDSGVRFNIKNPKNFVIEIIEGTNARSNLVLQRGASLNIASLIMPEGDKSSVWLNTFYGGIYEKEFIDFINQKNPKMRGEMETLLNVNDMFALSRDGESVLSFNGNIFCGPEVNPLDLSATNYTLKRLFRATNNSTAAPNNANAICAVKEGGCFDNLISFSNQKVDGKSYKVAISGTKIIPTYDIFIESGKIISKDNRTLASIAPNAKINEQNYGKCETPTRVAFEKAVVDEYLALNGIKKGDEVAQNVDSKAKDSAIAMDSNKEALMAQNATDTTSDNAKSPINKEMQAELDENIQDLLVTLGIKQSSKPEPKDVGQKEVAKAEMPKEAKKESKDLSKDSKESPKEMPKAVADSSVTKESNIAKTSKESTKESPKEAIKEEETLIKIADSRESAKKSSESKDIQIAQANKESIEPTKEVAKVAEAKKETMASDSKQIAQAKSADSKESAKESPKDSKETKIAQAAKEPSTKESIQESPKDSTKIAQTKEAPKATISKDSKDLADLKATQATKTASVDVNVDNSIDDEILKKALLESSDEQEIALPTTPKTSKSSGKDEFLIVEKDAYEKLNRDCYGDLKCLHKTLRPYDGVVWSKKSSKNNTNTLYIVNLTDNNLNVNCEIRNYYGKNIKQSYNLNNVNRFAFMDLKFETSYDRTQVICKTRDSAKSTNKIIVTPASFDLKYHFADEGTNTTPTLKAGNIRIEFEHSQALTMEGDVDSGFGGNLVVKNLTFTQKNKCDGEINRNVSAMENLSLRFKKGYLQNAYAEILANTVAFGHLNIDFAIANNDTCKSTATSLEPQCVGANIAKDISIVPANFRIKTDILTDSGQIAYYGQIDDKHTFKYNPLLSVDIEALDSDNKPFDVNKSCNYGSIELALNNDKLIEFKRSSSDRINAKIITYLRDFEKPTGTNIKTYFGINKITDEYKNSRHIIQSDVVEPNEVTLTDFKFNIRFKNGTSYFDYNNVEVYDRLDDNSNPLGILFVRGKLQTNDIKGDTRDSASLIAKYAIYCRDCNRQILAKYLQSEPEIESPYWYINNKHPSGLYLSNSFIKLTQNGKNYIMIQNSNKALEGRQRISFRGKKSGIYTIAIAQRSAEFAPYLNYNDKYKNSYIANNFNVLISEPEVREDILLDIETIKKEDLVPKSTTKSTNSTAKATQKVQNKDGVWLDIEEE